MKTILTLVFDIPAVDVFSALPHLLRNLSPGDAPVCAGDETSGNIEFCCLKFGEWECTMEP